MTTIQSGTNTGTRSDLTIRKMNAVDWVAMILLIIGGLNWALVGLFDIDVVAQLFGTMTMLSRIVYVVVGLAALYSIYLCVKQSGYDQTSTPRQA